MRCRSLSVSVMVVSAGILAFAWTSSVLADGDPGPLGSTEGEVIPGMSPEQDGRQQDILADALRAMQATQTAMESPSVPTARAGVPPAVGVPAAESWQRPVVPSHSITLVIMGPASEPQTNNNGQISLVDLIRDISAHIGNLLDGVDIGNGNGNGIGNGDWDFDWSFNNGRVEFSLSYGDHGVMDGSIELSDGAVLVTVVSPLLPNDGGLYNDGRLYIEITPDGSFRLSYKKLRVLKGMVD